MCDIGIYTSFMRKNIYASELLFNVKYIIKVCACVVFSVPQKQVLDAYAFLGMEWNQSVYIRPASEQLMREERK